MDQVVLETVGTVDLMFSITRGDRSERSRAFVATQSLTAIAGILVYTIITVIHYYAVNS